MNDALARLRGLLEAERDHHQAGANRAKYEGSSIAHSGIATGLEIALKHLDDIQQQEAAPDDELGAGLREQCKVAISRVLLDSAGRLVPKHIAETAQAVADSADAVLAVLDQQQAAATNTKQCDALCKDVERDRDEYEATVARVRAVLDEYSDDPYAQFLTAAIRAALDGGAP